MDDFFDLDIEQLALINELFDMISDGMEGYQHNNTGIAKEAAIGALASIPINLMTGQDVGRSLVNSGLGGLGAYGMGSLADALTENMANKKLKFGLTAGAEALGLLSGNLLFRKPKEDELLSKAVRYAQTNPQVIA